MSQRWATVLLMLWLRNSPKEWTSSPLASSYDHTYSYFIGGYYKSNHVQKAYCWIEYVARDKHLRITETGMKVDAFAPLYYISHRLVARSAHFISSITDWTLFLYVKIVFTSSYALSSPVTDNIVRAETCLQNLMPRIYPYYYVVCCWFARSFVMKHNRKRVLYERAKDYTRRKYGWSVTSLNFPLSNIVPLFIVSA